MLFILIKFYLYCCSNMTIYYINYYHITLMETIINNYMIDIGTSTTEEKIILIKTELNLDICINNCQIYPYGSSRIRYETRKTFDINIKKNGFSNNYNHYKIQIKKNNKEISKGANSKLFSNGGWNFDLKLWFPLKKECDATKIISSLPINYGDIYAQINNIDEKLCVNSKINNKKNSQKKFKYGLVVPFYNRAEYVRLFFNSLKNTNLSDVMIVLVDESMTNNLQNESKEAQDDKKKVNKLVNDFKLDMGDDIDNNFLLKIYKHKHGNMFDSILVGMDLLYSFCDFLITIDSDTIHKEHWIDELYKSYECAKKDFENDLILCSGFNVISERHSIIEKKTEYILKNSVGGCNMFFSSNVYIDIIRKCLMSHKWDTNIVNYIQKLNGKIITTNPSVIQHIGRDTSIDRKDKEIFDEALDF